MKTTKEYLQDILASGEYGAQRYMTSPLEDAICAAVEQRINDVLLQLGDVRKKLHVVATRDEIA